MSKQKKIIWIASYPKSGNTWVRIALSLALTGKLDLNKINVNSFSGLMKNYIKRDENLLKPGDVTKYWTNAQKLIASNIPDNSFRALKTHNVCAKIGNVNFPDFRFTAGLIYVVRDPRDVAVSYSNHFNTNMDETIQSIMKEDHFIYSTKSLHKSELISSWDKHVLSWVNSGFPKLILRYEDILLNTQESFNALFEFCRIKPKLSTKEIVQLSTFKNLAQLEKKDGFSESNRYGTAFFRSGKTNVWENYPKKMFNPFLNQFKDVMKKFNYN